MQDDLPHSEPWPFAWLFSAALRRRPGVFYGGEHSRARLPSWLLLWWVGLARVFAAEPVPIVHRPDPPPALDGPIPVLPQTIAVFSRLTLAPGAKQSFRFSVAGAPAGREAVLALKARMDTPRVAGYTNALQVSVNGQVLDGARLLNKPLRGTAADGRTHTLVAGQRFATFYSPDFAAADASSYGIAGVKSGEFELRITDLLRDGENEITITNAAVPAVKFALVAADGRVELRPSARPAEAKPRAGPPTGPLGVFEPATGHTVAYRVAELPESRLEIEIGGEIYDLASEFSTPDGQWVRASNPHFRHTRTIERCDEAILVRDTFENLTGENLPLQQRHRARAKTGMTRVWLGGLSPAGLNGSAADAQNPSLFGAAATSGLGLLPLNDEFQVHVRQNSADGVLALSDLDFALRPHAIYTAEWVVVPTARPDYFDFVNAARRLLNANFTIKECFAFLRAGPLTEKWSDGKFADFIRFKSANFVCASINHPTYRGNPTHGTSLQRVPTDSKQRWNERVRRLAPGVKTGVYFHCFLDTVEDSPTAFADSRHLRADGSQADYGQSIYKIFFPTATNRYGAAIGRNVDLILDEIRADGVYWDELEYSAHAYHYGEPWDGCSADIDTRAHQITRLKSSVTLISQPWRLAMAKKILARGPLIANGQPRTRTMAALQFPRFVETGSVSNCAHAQLHSPIALGDHLTERTEADAYRTMLSALDFGCLYHWYSDAQVIPEYPTLTQFMYPTTPLELHDGYLIAKERILTKRSGRFGWGDQSRHQVHVFNEDGREVPDFPVVSITREGNTMTELRLAEGWAAAIVRE